MSAPPAHHEELTAPPSETVIGSQLCGKLKLTDALLRSMKPSQRCYEVRDTLIPGLLVRVQPSGTRSFFFQYRSPVTARQRNLFIGRVEIGIDQARKVAKKNAGAVADKRDPHIETQEARTKALAAKTRTLRTFIEKKYGPWVTEHRRTGAETVKRLHATFEHLLDRDLASLTAWDVESWRQRRLKEGAKRATANRCIALLKATLSRAVEWGLLAKHPLSDVKPLRLDRRGIVRWLDQDEESRLRDALTKRSESMGKARERANEWRRARHKPEMPALGIYPDALEPSVLLSLLTGVRRGELFALRWGDIDLKGAVLTVRGDAAKSAQTRYIPLNKEATEILRTWRTCITVESPDESLFRIRTSLKKSFSAVLTSAKITAFRWHDMRHSFASRLVRNGVDLYVVQRLLGHASIVMTQRYAHLAPDQMRTAVERLAANNTETPLSNAAAA